MLQTIREHTQGWIAGTIITLIILSFALWGIHSYFIGGEGNTTVAEVNGIDITKEDLAVAYERLRRQVQIQYGANKALVQDETALKGRALQSLIDIEALKQASIKNGFLVSDAQIDGYLQGMPEFQVDGHFSVERFQELLASTLLSTSDFLDLIQSSLLIDQPKLGIVLSSFALPNETQYTMQLINQERSIQYLTIPFQYFLTQPITISPANVQAYYAQHKADFMTPEQVNVEYVQLTLKDLAATIAPTDVMLKNFYNENVNSYSKPMEWKIADIEIPISVSATTEEIAAANKKAETIAAALKKGEAFDKLAKENKQNLSGQNWLTLNDVPSELQQAVSDLAKPGDTSAPIKTSKAIVIVKLLDTKAPEIQAFENVKDKVKENYVRGHAEEKFAELRDQLADLTYERPDSLQSASKSLNLPIQTSELFAKNKPGKDISQYKKVRDAAFSNDVLNLQNNSDVIQLNPETLVVVRVKSHVASALLPLASVSKQIEDKLRIQEAEFRAVALSADLQKKLASGQSSPEQIASTYHFAWQTAGFVGRYSTKVDSAVLDLAFRLPNPTTTKAKAVYGTTRIPNGYALVALQGVKDGAATDKRQYSVFAEQIENSEGLLEYELYRRSQMANAKINVSAS